MKFIFFDNRQLNFFRKDSHQVEPLSLFNVIMPEDIFAEDFYIGIFSTMTSSDWFTSVRNKVPSLVHLPDVSSDELKNEGLWFLNKDGSCNITLAENAGIGPFAKTANDS
uniref:Oxidoreductase n=1 Tax=Heterorhabditis bacteriophora TaxID=37862 RepID=A0A1I7XI39_HETBA